MSRSPSGQFLIVALWYILMCSNGNDHCYARQQRVANAAVCVRSDECPSCHLHAALGNFSRESDVESSHVRVAPGDGRRPGVQALEHKCKRIHRITDKETTFITTTLLYSTKIQCGEGCCRLLLIGSCTTRPLRKFVMVTIRIRYGYLQWLVKGNEIHSLLAMRFSYRFNIQCLSAVLRTAKGRSMKMSGWE